MKMRKVIAAFLAAICLLTALLLGVSAQGSRTVYAKTDATVQQGNYGYCYIYLDDMTDLASLNVAVHYDPEIVTVDYHYNQVSTQLYDSSNQNGCLQYSYIFSGVDLSGQKSLFYFRYKISEDAPVGESYFDIVITDAFNASLETVAITGSRCKFSVTEKKISKTCSVYGSSGVYTSVQQQFQLDYRLSTNAIASGAFVIEYDPELFAFEELICGGLLDNKVVDVNSTLPGAIYVSFLGTEYNRDTQLISVKFRTIKNETTTTQINLRVTELYDLELNSISCNGYSNTVTLTHDPSYIGDAPAMRLDASYNEETEQVTLAIHLDANSHLGAGDFVLEFDENYLTFVSAQKGFTPSFFNINDKQVAEGILKFSIISMTDIVEAQRVLTIVFDVSMDKRDCPLAFTLAGSTLTDSMTEPIAMNFVDDLNHKYEPTVTAPDCENCGYTAYTCSVCNDRYFDDEVDALGHKWQDATCITPKTCANCGKTDGGLADHTRDYTHKCTACGHIGGKCGDNLTWEFDVETGKLTISGEGNMTNSPWVLYYGNDIVSVMIEDGATSIGSSAFYELTSLESVTIGNSVTSIGESAFSYCSSLESIEIPDSVTSIGDYAFDGCSSLESITIGNSVTSIGEFAFWDCSSLESITIPDSVTSIGYSAFYGCSSLESVTIGNSVTSIGVRAFYNCSSLESITIPDSVTYIEWGSGSTDSPFYGCTNLKRVVIGDGVTSIGDFAFHYCSSLESITIGNSITSIGNLAFDYCSSLTSITIPDSVTSIGNGAFSGCSSLTDVYISDLESWCKISFANAASNPLYYGRKLHLNGELVTNLEIPDGITSIGDHAFSRCTSLESITIPDSVTSIGYAAFYECNSLESVTIGNSVTNIGDYAFCRCNRLESINILGSVTNIGDYAFSRCTSLESITIPDSVASIGVWAFYECNSLNGITFEGDAPIFCDDVFYGVTATVYYPYGNATWTADVMRNYGGTITWVAYGAPHYGDLTGDGKINSLDGLLLMRYLNGWDVNIASPEAMDVNNDGKVNSLDGLILMRYLNGWDVTLG